MRNMEIKQLLRMAGEHQQAGRTQQALQICRQILSEHSDHAEALRLSGILAFQADSRAEAMEFLSRAIRASPAVADFHVDLAAMLFEQGRFEEAIAAYQQALKLEPTCAETYYELGRTLAECGRVDEALASYRQAVALRPGYAHAHNNMGNILYFRGQPEAALAAYRSAVTHDPRLAAAYNNMGNILQGQGNLDEAMQCYRQALVLIPDLPDAHFNLGSLYRQHGLLDECIATYRKAMRLNPAFEGVYDSLLLALHYHPDYSHAAIYDEHCLWGKQFTSLRQASVHRNSCNPDRPLRIGYVSSDLRHHSVAYFLLPLLKAHDHRHFHITCFSAHGNEDEVTARLRACTDCWRDISLMTDEQAAELVRQDAIDVLVDLSLHTANNRLLMFARKPAPVQVSYLGYPGTTGLDAIDYRLGDALSDPPESDQFSSEEVIRLPETAWCYDPLFPSPAVTTPPSAASGIVTFASFNNFSKINAALLGYWSEILRAIPGSRLLIKNLSLRSPSVHQRLRQAMHSRGVAEERLLIEPYTSTVQEHLPKYNAVDIALDTHPYHGTTTTCEALWMGVPVVTLAGETAASRVGISLLTNVGLPELVATSPEDYVRIAVELASDRTRLAALRATLRARMQSSPLMDETRFARNVENAYRTIWQNWCRQATSQSVASAPER